MPPGQWFRHWLAMTLLVIHFCMTTAQLTFTWEKPYFDYKNNGFQLEAALFSNLTSSLTFTQDHSIEIDLLKDIVVNADAVCSATYNSVQLTMTTSYTTSAQNVATLHFSFTDLTATASVPIAITCHSFTNPTTSSDTAGVIPMRLIQVSGQTQSTLASLELPAAALSQFVFGGASTFTSTSTMPLSNNLITEPISITGLKGHGPLNSDQNRLLIIEFPSQWPQNSTTAANVIISITIGSEVIPATVNMVGTSNGINGYRIPIDGSILRADDVDAAISISIKNFGMPARPLSSPGALNIYTSVINGTAERRLTGILRVPLPSLSPLVIVDAKETLVHSTHVANTWGSIEAKITHGALGVQAGELFMIGLPKPPSSVLAADSWRFKRDDLDAIISDTNNTYSTVRCAFTFSPANGLAENAFQYKHTFAYGYSVLTNRNSQIRLMTFSGQTFLEYVIPDSIPLAGTSSLNCTGLATPNAAISTSTPALIQFATYNPTDNVNPVPFAGVTTTKFAGISPRGTIGKPMLELNPNVTSSLTTVSTKITPFEYPLLRTSFLYPIHLPRGFTIPRPDVAEFYCLMEVNTEGKRTGSVITQLTPDYTPYRESIKVFFSSVSTDTQPSQILLECHNLQLPSFVVEPISNIRVTLSTFGDYLTIADNQILPPHGLRVFQEEFIFASAGNGELRGVVSPYTAGTIVSELDFTSPAPAVTKPLDFHLKLSPLITTGTDRIMSGQALELLLPGSKFDVDGIKSTCTMSVNTDPDPTSFQNFPDVGFEFFATNNIIKFDAIKPFIRVRARFNSDYLLAASEANRAVSLKCKNIGMGLSAFDQGYNAFYRVVDSQNDPIISNVTVWTQAIAPKPFASTIITTSNNAALTTESVVDLQFRFVVNNTNIQQSEFVQSNIYYQMQVDLGTGFSINSLYGFSCVSPIATFVPTIPHSQNERAFFTFPLPSLATSIQIGQTYTFTCRNISTPLLPQQDIPASLTITTGPKRDIFARGVTVLPSVTVVDKPAFGRTTRDIIVHGTAATGGFLDVDISPPAIAAITGGTSVRVFLPPDLFSLAPTNTGSSKCDLIVNRDGVSPMTIPAAFQYVTADGMTTVTATPTSVPDPIALTETDMLSMACSSLPLPRSVKRSRHAVISIIDTLSVPTYPHKTLFTLNNGHMHPFAASLFANGGITASFSPDSIGSVSTYSLSMQHTPADTTSFLGDVLYIPVPSDTNRTKDTPSSSITCSVSVNGQVSSPLTDISFMFPFTHIVARRFNIAAAAAIISPLTPGVVEIRCNNIRAPRHFDPETLILTAYSNGVEVARNPFVRFDGMGARILGSPRTLSLTPPYIMPLPDGALMPTTTAVTLNLALEPLPFQLLKGDRVLFQIHPALFFPISSALTLNGVAMADYTTSLGDNSGGGGGGDNGGGTPTEEDPTTDDPDHNLPPNPDDFLPVRRRHRRTPSAPHTAYVGYSERGLVTLNITQNMPYSREHPVPLNITITNVVPPSYAVPSELDFTVSVERPIGVDVDGKNIYRSVASTQQLVWGGVLPLQLGAAAFSSVAMPQSMRLTNVNVTVSPLGTQITGQQIVDVLYPASYDMLFSNMNFPPTSCYAVRRQNERVAPDPSVPLTYRASNYFMHALGSDSGAGIIEYTGVTFFFPSTANLSPTDQSGSLTIVCSNVRMPSTEHTKPVRIGVGIREKPVTPTPVSVDSPVGVMAVSSFDDEDIYDAASWSSPVALANTVTLDPTNYNMFTFDLTFPAITYTVLGADHAYITTGSRIAGSASNNFTLSLRPVPVEMSRHSVVEIAFPLGGWRTVPDKPVTCEFQYYSTNKASFVAVEGETSMAMTSTSMTLRFNFTTLPSGTYSAYVSKFFCKNIHVPNDPIRTALDNINLQVLHITPLSTLPVIFMQNKKVRMHATFPAVANQNYYTYFLQSITLPNLPKLLTPKQLAAVSKAYTDALANVGLREMTPQLYRLTMSSGLNSREEQVNEYKLAIMFQKPDIYTNSHGALLDSLASAGTEFSIYFALQLQHAGIPTNSLSTLDMFDLTVNCTATDLLTYDSAQLCGHALVSESDFCALGMLDCQQTNAAATIGNLWSVLSVMIAVTIAILVQ